LNRKKIVEDGYCVVKRGGKGNFELDQSLILKLQQAALILHKFGWPATFLAVYDEAWQLAQQCQEWMSLVSGNQNVFVMDIVGFYDALSERAKLFEALAKYDLTKRTVLLSGDVHFGEMNFVEDITKKKKWKREFARHLKDKASIPDSDEKAKAIQDKLTPIYEEKAAGDVQGLVEVTSSGMTHKPFPIEGVTNAALTLFTKNRIQGPFLDYNFGYFEIQRVKKEKDSENKGLPGESANAKAEVDSAGSVAVEIPDKGLDDADDLARGLDDAEYDLKWKVVVRGLDDDPAKRLVFTSEDMEEMHRKMNTKRLEADATDPGNKEKKEDPDAAEASMISYVLYDMPAKRVMLFASLGVFSYI
jgi:hypothetical protein